MLKRIITGIFAVAVLIPILVFSETVVFPIAIAVVCSICLYEMFKCVGAARKISLTVPAYIFGTVFPFLLRYFEKPVSVAIIGAIVSLFYLIYVFAHIIWSHGKLSFEEGLTVYTLTLYIVFAFS